PITNVVSRASDLVQEDLSALLKMNLLTAAFSGIAVFGLMLFAGAPLIAAILLGSYGVAMVLRWFARCLAFVEHSPFRAISSDMLYGACLTAALLSLALLHCLTILFAA